ncbi:anti-sigma regulatory factor [Coleofasciculus sp. FACHB-1120]|uniref:ATP-binding protein n=1 Tax=Coleofasciculus sp. FACHB-1120 TaxID=2692783 RepID=UPI001684D847|nr:anti-sigma regulatory factor [Coleofasciculus sp. FACHB-1120]MBD2744792.1 anti-sigma regulatory factor [Coleofasciculus sp. FACHB-1120]
MINKIHLKINTDCATSEQIISWFNQLNQPPISDVNIWWQCQTLLQEGFTNVVDHAHKNLPPDTPIEIEAVRYSQSIEIRIWNQGLPFDLEQKLTEVSDFEDNDAARGRGLKIMSNLADKLCYERMPDNRNCLLIIKNY